MADVQRTSWIAIRSGCVKLPSQSLMFSRTHTHTHTRTHKHTHAHARTYTHFFSFSHAFSGGTRSPMQSSPYLQQRFYFVSEHGLNRHRVRNKRFARSSLPGRGCLAPSAPCESAKLMESYERFAYKWLRRARRTTRYTGYKVSNAQGGATKGQERKKGFRGARRYDFIGRCLTGDKRVSSRRYKASRIPVFICRLHV